MSETSDSEEEEELVSEDGVSLSEEEMIITNGDPASGRDVSVLIPGRVEALLYVNIRELPVMERSTWCD